MSRDTIFESMSLQNQYEKDKAYADKILKAKPLEVKKNLSFWVKI